METVREKVKEIIAEQLGVEVDEIKDNSSLQDFNPDSLDTVEIVMQFEDTFEISIPDEDAQKWATVDDIVKYIEEKKSLQEAT